MDLDPPSVSELAYPINISSIPRQGIDQKKYDRDYLTSLKRVSIYYRSSIGRQPFDISELLDSLSFFWRDFNRHLNPKR